MGIYILRRVLIMVPILLGASVLCFLLIDLSGDPVQNQVVAYEQQHGEAISLSARQAIEERLYHDRNLPERYWLWLTGLGETNGDIGLLQGKFGPSTEGPANNIGSELKERFGTTFRLVAFATLASIALAVITGVVSAVRQYSKLDHVLTFVGFLALALPTFWFAKLMKEAGVQLNDLFRTDLFKTWGDETPGFEGSAWATFADALPYLIIPTFVLMLTGYASLSRYQRSAMLEVLNSEYIRLARAKGVPDRTVMRRHALRTALIPVATFGPLGLSFALGGSIVIEKIFGWQGIGAWAFTAITDIDTFAAMAYLMLSGTLVMLSVILSDVLYGVIDPRIRLE
ncbi:ABC transporter permease [Salininema proteolyticum]|uniref:ABC transporter permease n=1 Tax=Salininema proteolyticum TaxID=1607685 RepID=A0ABV8U1N4_9ACTN